jgi:nucleoid DNA-binding protein
MNKTTLVRAVWTAINQIEGVNVSQAEASTVLDTVLTNIEDSLSDGNDLVIQNFGRLYFHLRKPTRKTHPKDPSIVLDIPAKPTVKFRAFNALKTAVQKRATV